MYVYVPLHMWYLEMNLGPSACEASAHHPTTPHTESQYKLLRKT